MFVRTIRMTVIAATLIASPAFAETLAIDGQVSVKASSIETPARGTSMSAVEAKFGAPANKTSSVGGGGEKTPPITKWFYPTFVVVFENDKVIHTVVVPG
jgi:hypothetical protein